MRKKRSGQGVYKPSCHVQSSRSEPGVDSSSDSDVDGGSTFFSRRVTAENWNANQTLSVAAKLDFKYDGTQVRQLRVWLRKVSDDGQTIERRSLGRFSVSFSRISLVLAAANFDIKKKVK